MMAYSWWNSEFEQFSRCDQFFELENFEDESASLEYELIKEKTSSELRDADYENQFYSHFACYPMHNDCCSEDYLQNSPTATLAELNGSLVDNVELLDSIFLGKPGLIPDSARQVICHRGSFHSLSSVMESDVHDRSDNVSSNQFSLPLAKLKHEANLTNEKESVIAMTVKSEVYCKSEGLVNVAASVLVDGLPSREVDSHAKKQQFSNVRVKSEVQDIKSNCEMTLPRPTMHKLVKWSSPGIVEPPPKKVKTDSCLDVLSNIKKECSWSPTNDSDDSDIENFDDTVSDDDTASASTGENFNETAIINCASVDAQKRYFWLYNVQAKGPKGRQTSAAQLNESCNFLNPHVLHSFEEPAHSGGRRTRGSDIDANPRRLLQIGAEIHRLSAVVNRSPDAAEALLSPREKNKYASRICRLKRKAQHEANKIKLQGLDMEHSQLMNVLDDIKASIVQRVREIPRCADPKLAASSARIHPTLTSKLESLVQTHLSDMIAEHTNEYVSCELQKVKNESRSQRV